MGRIRRGVNTGSGRFCYTTAQKNQSSNLKRSFKNVNSLMMMTTTTSTSTEAMASLKRKRE
ncbi:hypothetical protein BLOT_015301 [Blomia tropicalis]|nr:hypothetical protein BLOT_015301 [Blomia tropicalis]